jgi:hypothetical protein
MTSEPKRLFHEDPGVAHLVAASEKDGPSSDQMEKLLSLATDAAIARRTPWRWAGPSFAVGIAFIGAAVLGISAGSGPSRTEPALANVSFADAAVEALVSERTTEAPVVTVSIHDLAPAPPPSSSSDLSARGSGARGPATAVARRIPPPAAPHEGAAGSQSARQGELPPTGAGHTTFDEELALVSAARSFLQRGDVPSCMRTIETYRERFGSGTFAHEIEVIRIEGMMASGDRARAHAAAEAFLAAHRASPYADRVRSLLERSSR